MPQTLLQMRIAPTFNKESFFSGIKAVQRLILETLNLIKTHKKALLKQAKDL